MSLSARPFPYEFNTIPRCGRSIRQHVFPYGFPRSRQTCSSEFPVDFGRALESERCGVDLKVGKGRQDFQLVVLCSQERKHRKILPCS